MKLQAVYTLAEFAQLSSLAKKPCRRLLDQCGIRYIWNGKKILVPLSEIKLKIPRLYDSIMAMHLRSE
jgi:hypothetical protein